MPLRSHTNGWIKQVQASHPIAEIITVDLSPRATLRVARAIGDLLSPRRNRKGQLTAFVLFVSFAVKSNRLLRCWRLHGEKMLLCVLYVLCGETKAARIN
jgi:hypothetical protein